MISRSRSGHRHVLFLPGADGNREDEAQAGSGLFLSLYLVLLAFFAALTMNGTFDTARAGQMMRSVSGALTSYMPQLGAGGTWAWFSPFKEHNRYPDAGEARRTAVQIARVLTDFGFSTPGVAGWRGVLIMKASMKTLFKDGDVRLDPSRMAMLSRLAHLLGELPGAQVSFLVGERDPLAIKRAVFLDTQWPLIAPFVPAEIGILPGTDELTVRVHVPGLS